MAEFVGPLDGRAPYALGREMAVNFHGLHLTRRGGASCPVLEANGGGHIVNVLSLLSLASFAADDRHAASKAAAHSLTQAPKLVLARAPWHRRARRLPLLGSTPTLRGRHRLWARPHWCRSPAGVSRRARLTIPGRHLPRPQLAGAGADLVERPEFERAFSGAAADRRGVTRAATNGINRNEVMHAVASSVAGISTEGPEPGSDARRRVIGARGVCAPLADRTAFVKRAGSNCGLVWAADGTRAEWGQRRIGPGFSGSCDVMHAYHAERRTTLENRGRNATLARIFVNRSRPGGPGRGVVRLSRDSSAC